MSYFEKGINGLLFDGRVDFKPSKINQEIQHHAIKKSLNPITDAFKSYID
jgi:hypothetical protein